MIKDSLPRGWGWATLGEIASINMGQSPPSSSYNDRKIGLPFYQGKADFGEIYPSPRVWCLSPLKIAESGDVLISVRAPVGPTNLCAERSCIGRGLAAIRPLEGMPSEFWLCYLRFIERRIAEMGTGSTFTAISRRHLENLSVPLPPLNEQKRIAAEIKELFRELRTAGKALKRIPVLIKQFRQSLLAAAFRGELTIWHRNSESGIELAEQAKGYDSWFKRKKSNHHTEGTELSEDKEIPAGWTRVRLGDICRPIETINPEKQPNKTLQYVDIASIDNKRNVIAAPKTILGRDAPSRARQKIKKGDTLFSTVRTYLKNIAMVTNEYDGEVCSTGFCVIRPMPFMNPEFVFYYVLTDEFISEVTPTQTGILYPATKDSIIFEQSVLVPPRKEQDEISSKLRLFFYMASIVEKGGDAALTDVNYTEQSVLSKAFRGELVPQDPSDEPALVILERIKARRAISKKASWG